MRIFILEVTAPFARVDSFSRHILKRKAHELQVRYWKCWCLNAGFTMIMVLSAIWNVESISGVPSAVHCMAGNSSSLVERKA